MSRNRNPYGAAFTSTGGTVNPEDTSSEPLVLCQARECGLF